MRAVFVRRVPSPRHAQKRFVHQRSRVERPRLALPSQVARRKLLELVVDQRDDCVQRLPVAGLNALQEFRDLHGATGNITARTNSAIRLRRLESELTNRLVRRDRVRQATQDGPEGPMTSRIVWVWTMTAQ